MFTGEMIKTEVGLTNALRGREKEFPVLAAAVRDMEPTDVTVVEWIDQAGHHTNYTQIFREPTSAWELTSEMVADSLTRLLANAERVVTKGAPYADDHYSMCGGARHFLGRDFHAGDTIQLRTLSDLCEIRWEQYPADSQQVRHCHEWTVEFSLTVSAP